MVKISGHREHLRRLERLRGEAAMRQVEQALVAGGNTIAVEAQISITNGAKTGRIYTHEFRTINGRAVPTKKRTSPHQASAPGEAPADDDGDLVRGIEYALVGPLKVEISSNAKHAAFMEWGTSKVAERPYLRPAVQRKKREVVDLVRQAVSNAVRDSGR